MVAFIFTFRIIITLSYNYFSEHPLICFNINEVFCKSCVSEKSVSSVFSVDSAISTLNDSPLFVDVEVLSKSLYEGDPERKGHEKNYSSIGKVIMISNDRLHGKVKCLLLSGPENRAGLEVLLPEGDMKTENLLHCAFSFPRSSTDENVPFVFALGLKKVAVLVDPFLLEVLSYRPRILSANALYQVFLKTKLSELQVKKKRKTSGSESETTKTTTKIETSTATTSDVRSSTRDVKTSPPLAKPKSWKHYLSEWFPLIQRLMLHVDVDSCTIFLPSKPLKICSTNGLSNSIHRTYLTRNERPGLGDTMFITLPHVYLQNAAFKSNLINLMTDLPIVLPPEAHACGKLIIIIMIIN